MTREQVNAYLFDIMGTALETKVVNETLFVKFDFLPYHVREFIHSQPDYDQSLMQPFVRECECGQAYFLDAVHFYNIMLRFKI